MEELCQRIQRLNSSSTLLFIKSNILGDGWLWTRLFMSSTKLPDASKGLLFVFMRLEGLNQAIEGFQHESLKSGLELPDVCFLVVERAAKR